MTNETIRGYFDALGRHDGWEAFLAEAMTFTSFASPMKQLAGKAMYLQATKRFYSMIASVQLRGLIVDGDKACALTRYELQPPGGDRFTSDVAELFTVKEGKIDSFGIYFDTAPYPK